MADNHRPWTRQGEAFSRAHHEAWKRSDLNQRQYCEAEGIPLKAFGNWRARFTPGFGPPRSSARFAAPIRPKRGPVMAPAAFSLMADSPMPDAWQFDLSRPACISSHGWSLLHQIAVCLPCSRRNLSQHFLMKLVFAAPARGFPSLLIALVAHVWAKALPVANAVIKSARAIRFMGPSSVSVYGTPNLTSKHVSLRPG